MRTQLIRASKTIGLFIIAAMIVVTPLTANAWDDPEIRDFNLECVDEDGSVTAKLFSVTLYKLKKDDGTVIDSWEDRNQKDGNLIEYTKTDLPDGEYTLYVENFDGDKIKKDFTVDCDQPEPITCPFDSSDGTVVTFDERIRSDKTKADSRTQTENLNLSAGTYTIKFYGYDRYDGRDSVSQPQESYYLSLLSESNEVASTDELGDLDDRVSFAERTKTITGFTLSTSTDEVVGIHAAYPDTSSPNSLNALCAAFEKTDEPDKPELQLSKQCVNDSGKISVTAPNGLDSYELFNTDTQASIASSSNSVAAGSVIEIDSLDDGNYRFEGTLGNNFETLTFSIDCDTPTNNLTGSCDVSPKNVEPGESVTWSASASGGTSPYSYSWNLEGSDDDDNTQNISTSYNNEGSFNGTVTITDDAGDQIDRTCSVSVEEEDDNGGGGGGGGGFLRSGNGDDDDDGEVRGERDFNVQCVPEESSYLAGEVVNFSATVGGDTDDEDDADFDWSGDELRSEDNENATAQYTSTGIKEMRVEAEYRGETESDTCYVQIRRAGGITLDQVPYTGPADTAKTVGFILAILLLGLGGGYAVIRRREEEGIPIGIPTNQG